MGAKRDVPVNQRPLQRSTRPTVDRDQQRQQQGTGRADRVTAEVGGDLDQGRRPAANTRRETEHERTESGLNWGGPLAAALVGTAMWVIAVSGESAPRQEVQDVQITALRDVEAAFWMAAT